MAHVEASFGGSSGSQFRLGLDVDEISVDSGNNRSLVNVSVYMVPINTGTRVYNLYNTPNGNVNIDGNVVGFSGPYDFRNNANRRYYIQNYQQWIGHNSDGSRNIGVSAYMDAADDSFVTTAGTGLNLWLSQIPRYANIDGFNIDWVTDEAIRFSWHSDRPVDYISWWSSQIDGGAHHDEPMGGQGWFIKEIHNLISERQYDIHVAIRNAASGLWTESGVQYPITLGQNNFIMLL